MKKIAETLKRMLTKRGKSDTMICKKMHMCCANTYGGEYKRQMNVKFLANRLIQHFWNIRINGQRVKCTRTKIGKLLTIVQILSIKYNNQIAFEDTIAEETCGTSIPVLSVHRYPYDIWELYTCKTPNATDFFEKNSSINLSDMVTVNESLPDLYAPQGEVDNLLQRIINDVFMEFGTYDGYEIGKLINQFKDGICFDGVVCKEKVIEWLTNIDTQTTNPIISFIHNYSF